MPKHVAWIKADAILGKPNQSLQAKMIVKTSSELGRWVAAHLEQGYTVTLTKVEQTHAATSTVTRSPSHHAG